MALRNKSQVSVGSYHESDSGTLASAAAIGIGATSVFPVDVTGFDTVTILGRMTGAVGTDAALTVQPYEADGTTVSQVNMNVSAPSNQFAGGVVYFTATLQTRGVTRIQVSVKNNNAGAQTIQKLDYFRET